jgi:hypothetical protein
MEATRIRPLAPMAVAVVIAALMLALPVAASAAGKPGAAAEQAGLSRPGR